MRINRLNSQAMNLVREALKIELQACRMLEAIQGNEPTRSRLHYTTALLAYVLGDWDKVLFIIEQALLGFPDGNIKKDLLDLESKVKIKE